MTKLDRKGFAGCTRILAYVLGISAFYPIFLLGASIGMELPMKPIALFWGIVKLAMAYAVICVYRSTKEVKTALVGVLLASSGIFSFLSVPLFLASATEALAITGLSLVLFDLGKVLPTLGMDIPAGLIFLGVVFSILNSPTMNFVGLVALLAGLLLSSVRVRKIKAVGTG